MYRRGKISIDIVNNRCPTFLQIWRHLLFASATSDLVVYFWRKIFLLAEVGSLGSLTKVKKSAAVALGFVFNSILF